jgi:hypothetical protein
MVNRDRRRAPRWSPHPSEPVSRVRVRAGRELAVINVSSTGVLVEGEARLLPGRHLDVHVVTAAGRTLVRSRVVRASVEGLWSDRVLYRGARMFDHSLEFGPVATQVNDAAAVIAAGNAVPGDDE